MELTEENYCYECGKPCDENVHFCGFECASAFSDRNYLNMNAELSRITRLRKKMNLPHFRNSERRKAWRDFAERVKEYKKFKEEWDM